MTKARVLFLVCFVSLANFIPITKSWSLAYAHQAQDLLAAGRRSDTLEELVQERFWLSAARLGEREGLSYDLFLHGKFFYGFPVISDYGIMRSDLFRVQGSLILSWSHSGILGGRNLDLYLGFHGVRYGLSTPITLSLPSQDPFESSLSVADYVSSQFFDDLIDFRLVLTGLGSLRLGWIQNEIYTATLDGRVERNQAHLETRERNWVFELEALSLLRFYYRMDSRTRVDSWRVSTDVFKFLISWLASGAESSLLNSLLTNTDSPEAGHSRLLKNGLPWLTLGLHAENYYREYSLPFRGSGDANLYWQVEAGYRVSLSSRAWLGFELDLGFFSRSWARWHEGRRLREFSIGLEASFDLGLEVPEFLLDLVVNPEFEGYNSLRMNYFVRYGSFTDAALSVLKPEDGQTATGFRLGTSLVFWNSLELELAYSQNDPRDLRKFVEAVGRGVFEFRIGIRY